MVDSATSFVINKLVSLLNSEVQLLRGVHEEFADIRDELQFIRAFLRDAETRKETSAGVKEWVKQVREAAFQVEDVIDEYMLHLSRGNGDRNSEFKALLLKIASFVKRLKPRHEIAAGFQSVKAKLREINEKRLRYNLIPSEPGGLNAATTVIKHDPRRGSIFVEESELLGVESLKEELMRQLVEGSPQRKVICIVGMGGVGKTTLARKIFDSKTVTSHFLFQVWITVSQSYTKEELLRSILKQLTAARKETYTHELDKADHTSLTNTHEIDTADHTSLTNTHELDKADHTSLTFELRKRLQNTRCLVVFDDVWETDFWSDVTDALRDNKRGSRVVITTRIKDVGYNCKKSSLVHVKEMCPLSYEDAWQLFCHKTFKFDSDGQCPEELKQLSEEIVKRCKGLPLAIVTVGGLLSSKEKVVSEWEKFHYKLVAALQSDRQLESVIRILSLSYDDLPYSLKACFLYLGMFPEDYLISRGRLIRLWVAEGFVNGEQGQLTPEEVAEEYMMQLVSRSLIQVEEVNFLGKPRFLRVHDWIREVILSKSDELSISQVPSFLCICKGTPRHLSVCGGIKHTSSESITESQTRSIMVFKPGGFSSPHLKRFKLLKVLDLRDFEVDSHAPVELRDLFLLGYLTLRVDEWSTIPTSIFKLFNLETLDLTSATRPHSVHISQLSKLRHLLIKSNRQKIIRADAARFVGFELEGSIKRLEFLQTLYHVRAESVLGLIPGLRSLKHLKKLGICDLETQHGKALSTALEGMPSLRWLRLQKKADDLDNQVIDLQHRMCSPPLMLERLELIGRLEKLPEWLRRLRNLMVLNLVDSGLKEDPFPVLQTLPRLEQLEACRESSVLVIAGGGFSKLKTLRVDGCTLQPEIIKAGGAIRS